MPEASEISTFASEVFSINIISTVLSYLFLFLYFTLSQKAKNYYECILIFSIQIFFTTIGTEWLYSIFEEYQYITIRSVIFKLISIVLLFIFVKKPGDYLKYAAITVFAVVGSNMMNFFHSKKICDLRITFSFDWKKIVKPILIIFASNIAIQIYVSSDTTMLGYMTDDYTVGIYSVSTKIYNIIKPVLAAALTVSIPRLSYYVGQKKKRDYDDLLYKVANTLFLVVMPAIVGIIVLSKNIVLIVGGSKYLQSQNSLRLLCIALIFSIFSGLLNQCVLIPYKKEKYSLMSSIISATENILLNLILIPIIAENGAAITTIIAELTMMLMNYHYSKKYIQNSFKNKNTLNNLITVAIGCIAIFTVSHASCIIFNNLFTQTIVAIVSSIIVYIIILMCLKNPFAISLIKKGNENNLNS